MSAADALTRVINTVLPGTVKPTDADQLDARPTPDVNAAGAGDTPITPPMADNVQAPSPAVLPPVPAVSIDAEPLPGARMRASDPPARTVGLTNYRIGSGEVVRIVRGDSAPRRVVVTIVAADMSTLPHMATTAAQDRSGLPLPFGTTPVPVELLHCPDNLYVYLPPPDPADPTEYVIVSVLIEPHAGCGCHK